ncbi:MAG TPA: type I methionyl aminopeptidase [Patescibacteria group bacterium]|nr:type I methionyl aminopeptidase [Patescibacteria group bacterium]
MNKRFTKTDEEIELIAENGKIIRDILYRTAQKAVPGVYTIELGDFALQEIRKAGGHPSFLGYGSKQNPFPSALCTSINDEVVHGVPSRHVVLMEGDILGLDIGMIYKGLYTDTAITVPIGKVSSLARKLIDTAELALTRAIQQAVPGKRIGDIAAATQKTAETAGFSVVRDLVGHGVGYAVHEDPMVPNYGKAGTGLELYEGMVLAIEPMLCEKSHKVILDNDGWTIRTADGGLSAHFEHTIAIKKSGAAVLT